MMKKRLTQTTIGLILTTTLAGCGSIPYRIEVDQGNVIEKKALDRLQVGMNKQQVQGLLGSALLQDAFHSNRWDYLQRYRNPETLKTQTSKVSLFFTNGLLRRIEKDGYSQIETVPIPYTIDGV